MADIDDYRDYIRPTLETDELTRKTFSNRHRW